ncbi:MAG: hypothetical protein ACPLZ9_05785 [Candidatus Ratteibacteria bacterium]
MNYIKIPFDIYKITEFLSIDGISYKIVKIDPYYESKTEVHKNFIDIFIVKNGEAKVIIGNIYYGGNEDKEGEIRDCIINNYEEVIIREGEILIIPNNTAHKVIVEHKPYISIVIKIKLKL